MILTDRTIPAYLSSPPASTSSHCGIKPEPEEVNHLVQNQAADSFGFSLILIPYPHRCPGVSVLDF